MLLFFLFVLQRLQPNSKSISLKTEFYKGKNRILTDYLAVKYGIFSCRMVYC